MSVDSPLDPDSKTVLMSVGQHTSYRNTDFADKSESNQWYGKRFSDFVSLTEGQYYFVEATLGQGVGAVHIDVGMEIVPDNMPSDHPNLERQVQRMMIGQTDIIMDTMICTVTNPD